MKKKKEKKNFSNVSVPHSLENSILIWGHKSIDTKKIYKK